MKYGECRQLLTIYPAWKGGDRAPTQAFERALDARRESVVTSDLGPLESLDL